MISQEIEDRIARYYFHRYLPDHIMVELESLLLPYFLEEEEPSADDIVRMAVKYIDDALAK